VDNANTGALARQLTLVGMDDRDIARVFRTFNSAAEPFLSESVDHESQAQR
jgi:hypothetical protein